MEREIRGKNFVFVGGTSGIGRALAVEVARRGARVLVVGRDRERAETTLRLLHEAGAVEATWLQADLLSVAGMDKATQEIRAWSSAIHGLVHSAMTVKMKRTVTADGLELAFGLQYLARAALNLELVEALTASGDGRIVHIGGKPPAKLLPDLHDLQFEKRRWSPLPSLMSSQVLGFLHVQEASRRWGHLPVSINIACVGPTNTDSIREQPWWARAIYKVIATSPERSAQNATRLLLDDGTSRPVRGCAFLNPKSFSPGLIAYDAELAEKVWVLTHDLLASKRAHR